MKRLLWLGVGIAVGALVVRQVTRTIHAYSPAGLASSARNSAAGVQRWVGDFISDVRDGMAEREEQIRAAMFVDMDDFLDDQGEDGTYGAR